MFRECCKARGIVLKGKRVKTLDVPRKKNYRANKGKGRKEENSNRGKVAEEGEGIGKMEKGIRRGRRYV